MSTRDQLAADLHEIGCYHPTLDMDAVADRLIALGWTRLEEERLARALTASSFYPYRSGVDYGAGRPIEWRHLHDQERAMLAADAAAIAKAYREDPDA